MPSPVVANDFDSQTTGMSLCEAMQVKLLNNDLHKQLLGYLFTSTGEWSTDVARDLLFHTMQSTSPIGVKVMWSPVQSSLVDHEEWVPVDGRAVSREIYARLFAVLGTTYGAGDGSTTFNIPDWRSRFAMFHGAAYPVGSTGGEAEVILTVDEIPAHSHTLAFEQNGASGATLWPQRENGAVTPTYPEGGDTGETGGGAAHNNLPPYIVGMVYLRANHKFLGTIL